ncbi:MAG: 1-deoxy-D-xylulose-5-phosphate reductoisomerase [Paludibacteraceae bacterium]|nr:1-deoxy-D-xylulose-5-phosphate reductoisomerase [Bacteroidales bacterium]MBQ3680452.1 1-deoxy-D-xylulose-5-phosphate reductoisomerase [Paludibacteraceae bacterium]MBQ3896423.1 1-deoxy-D-xylulose-5-phosphate reductoisomerase [Paludibacteraceae bacterium]MBQ7748480.1 1-deoxy-D-xylulose-5-phosphate reductoisomerase [Paludibacteraceae bacterium]MBR0497662.1 1-deoxy-D-xylulose-5-phosphate reductoisomerase [Paludibacteraceae bacterium]
MSKKKIAILGSTGSIGTQTLEVIEEHPDLFEAYALTANHNADLLIEQARKFNPEFVVIADETLYGKVKDALSDLPMKVYAGSDAICEVASMDTIDVVLTAMVGYAGLKPTIAAIKAHKTIALANKETLVVAGQLVERLSMENHAPILPVDSEHSAIFQCINGENPDQIEKIIITASGGPFLHTPADQLKDVTPAQALNHPNWSMGAKITIDSASMMNKGFEVIEAKWLFGLQPEQIDVIVHPQSIVHSMVQYVDGAVKAQLGIPDMKLPIQYALTYPNRVHLSAPRLDFRKDSQLTFLEPDTKKFRNLTFAFEALRRKGNAACVLNAANEVVVNAFLHEKIGFLTMSDIIEKTMEKAAYIAEPTYEDYVQSDKEARRIAEEML